MTMYDKITALADDCRLILNNGESKSTRYILALRACEEACLALRSFF